MNSTANPPSGFDVFISYSHVDVALAERLSRRIRRYRLPRSVGASRRRLRVFRDVERLTAHNSVSQALLQNVRAAKSLVVLCSPSAAASKYVNDEVVAFVECQGTARVHVVLAAGTLQEALPPALAGLTDPLYVDLRPPTGWFRRRPAFRRESLRVVAAASQVDYTRIRRQDERRRRWQWLLGAAATLVTSLVLGAVLLVRGVPADAWVRVPVPEELDGVRLSPASAWAVYRLDPEVRVFRAAVAEYVARFPRLHIGAVLEGVPNEAIEGFEGAVIRHLDGLSSGVRQDVPVGTFSFRVIEDWNAAQGVKPQSGPPREWGHGEISIGATRLNQDPTRGTVLLGPEVSFSRVLRYSGRTLSGDRLELSLPKVFGPDLFNIESWPLQTLYAQGGLPEWGYARGELRTPWARDPQPVVYRIQNNLDVFDATSDPAMRERIFTDGDPRRVVEVGGRRVSVGALDAKSYDMLERDSSWAVYQRPRFDGARNVSGMVRDEYGDRELLADGRKAVMDDPVMLLLERTLTFHSQLRHQILQVTREGLVPLDVLSIITTQATDAPVMGRPVESRFFLRHGEADEWRPLPTLQPKAGTSVVDVVLLDQRGSRLLLATDGDGYHLTTDAGATWTPFNLGESALSAGGRLETLVVGDPPIIYTLVDRAADDQRDDAPKPLFRFVHRGVVDRLRAALAALSAS